MDGLVLYARRELALIGVDKEEIDNTIAVVQAFVNARDSGMSAAWRIAVLHDLLRFQPLSPLTDDSDEWMLIAQRELFDTIDEDIWQSRRNPEAFSNDGGKTFYLVSEVKGDYRKYYYSEEKNSATPGRNNGSNGVETNSQG